MVDTGSLFALWLAVILSGVYHGVNPGMGWPLAVSAGLMEQRKTALPKAIMLLGAGHLLAMLAILLPFSLISVLLSYEHELRVGAGVIVVCMGVYLLINRRHPKILSRIHPARLASWSFLAAFAHGAGLMLVPIYLGICAIDAGDTGHLAARSLMGNDIKNALSVAVIHTLAMTLTGAGLAFATYIWLGLKFVARSWFNLDAVWALSLVVVGSAGIYATYTGH